jgi:hypothetical protein
MKRNLLITETSKYTRIFQIRNDAKVYSIYFQKFSGDVDLTFNGTPMDHFDFPDPITYNILFRLFYIYLRTTRFEEAADLLVLNKTFAFAVYRQIYGKFEPKSVLTMIKRLSRTIQLVEAIHDEYLTERNYAFGLQPPYVAIRFERRSTYTNPLAPWDFYPSIILEGHTAIGACHEGPMKSYYTGPYYGDLVQVVGESIHGVVEATQIHHPVFTFILGTMSQSLIPSETDFWHNRYFKKFSRLLRTVYGKHAGIYFMVNPTGVEESPFITQSDTFIRF